MVPAVVGRVANRMIRCAPRPSPSWVALYLGSEIAAKLTEPAGAVTRNATVIKAPTEKNQYCARDAPANGPHVPAFLDRAKRLKSPMNSHVQLYAMSRSSRSGNVRVYVNPLPRAPAVNVNERGRAGRQAQSCPKSKSFNTIYDAYAPKATSATVETQFRYRIAR